MLHLMIAPIASLLGCSALAFAAERIIEAEVEARTGLAKVARSPPARVEVTMDMSLLRRACWEGLALDVR
ncbi:hypothetical protein [Poseidonocella pacifica]|uniref:hypothetical protein n=1 Tax=Poseidonocella pacifica TaxID=871651 RepID=UPI00111407C5|nr:hypothetical protein [Poseidonocella pacifica]